ncbi:MAG: ASKHA domain-containing protein [Fimbriimonadales bacterium]|nr:ASKHA domain-containing protein [Fimbriimonadales bacterium]
MRIDAEFPDGPASFVLGREHLGQTLSAFLRRENRPLNTRCGEKGLCDACRVELLRPDGTWESVRACQLPLDGSRDLRVRVPQRSLLAYEPQVLEGYRVNVPVAHDPIRGTGLGVAVDVGTTTVVVQIVDFESGQALARASMFNRQMHFGDDVLTRINLCGMDGAMLAQMQRAVAHDTIRPLVLQALEECGRALSEVGAYAFAGNTTMLHLLAREDPSPMGVAPFTPRFLGHRVLRAEDLGLEPRNAEAHLLPGAAAYVGADLTGGVFASGLVYDEGPSLLVDVGTNGEIVFRHGDRLLGCATAAGPAFEGSGLTNGVRAGVGAISHLRLKDGTFEPELELIEPEKFSKPLGLCGSAYVDFLAEGRRTGLLGPNGRWAPESLAAAAGRMVPTADYGPAFRVAQGLGRSDIVVSLPDVASLLQAKAAIAAGILTLLDRTGVEPAQVRTLYLAGGFGMHLNLENAVRCGLLPGFRPEQVQLVGNTSLAGAHLALVDSSVLAELARIGSGMEVVELNLDPLFEDRYIDQLRLP